MTTWEVEGQEAIRRILKSVPQEDIGIVKQEQSLVAEVSFNITTLKVGDKGIYLESVLPFDFDDALPIVTELNHAETKFILEPGTWNLEGKGLSSDFPSKIKVNERRVSKRRSFLKVEVYLTVRVHRGKTLKDIKARIDNVSPHGLGLTFQTSDEFFFHSTLFEIIEVNGTAYAEKEKLIPKHVRFLDEKCTVGLYSEKGLSKNFLQLISSPLRTELGEKELEALQDEFNKLISQDN